MTAKGKTDEKHASSSN